jgi:four helix bundle protein
MGITSVTPLADLEVLKLAEGLADDVWRIVSEWVSFAKQTLGTQWVRAVDSVGANIVEAYGRYHYGENIQFLYCARGSVYETKYWLNRCVARNLIDWESSNHLAEALSETARQINAFANSLKSRRYQKTTKSTRENEVEYTLNDTGNVQSFTEEELLALTLILNH